MNAMLSTEMVKTTMLQFGYNSFIYDDVALGNRIIYGAFTINFTEPDKLRNVIAQSKVNDNPNTDTASSSTREILKNTHPILKKWDLKMLMGDL